MSRSLTISIIFVTLTTMLGASCKSRNASDRSETKDAVSIESTDNAVVTLNQIGSMVYTEQKLATSGTPLSSEETTALTEGARAIFYRCMAEKSTAIHGHDAVVTEELERLSKAPEIARKNFASSGRSSDVANSSEFSGEYPHCKLIGRGYTDASRDRFSVTSKEFLALQKNLLPGVEKSAGQLILKGAFIAGVFIAAGVTHRIGVVRMERNWEYSGVGSGILTFALSLVGAWKSVELGGQIKDYLDNDERTRLFVALLTNDASAIAKSKDADIFQSFTSDLVNGINGM